MTRVLCLVLKSDQLLCYVPFPFGTCFCFSCQAILSLGLQTDCLSLRSQVEKFDWDLPPHSTGTMAFNPTLKPIDRFLYEKCQKVKQ